MYKIVCSSEIVVNLKLHQHGHDQVNYILFLQQNILWSLEIIIIQISSVEKYMGYMVGSKATQK